MKDYLIKKLHEVFDDEEIRIQRNYLYDQIRREQDYIDTHKEEAGALAYSYYKLIKLYKTVKYYVSEEARDNIEKEIIPEYKNLYELCKADINMMDDNKILDDMKKYREEKLNNMKKTYRKPIVNFVKDNDIFDGATPYFDMTYSMNKNDIKEFCTTISNDDFDKAEKVNVNTLKDASSKISPDISMNIEADKKNLEKYEMVQHPTHYNKYSVEAFEIARRVFYPNDDAGFATFCECTAFLYRCRLGEKPGNSITQELNKETWWLNKAKEFNK